MIAESSWRVDSIRTTSSLDDNCGAEVLERLDGYGFPSFAKEWCIGSTWDTEDLRGCLGFGGPGGRFWRSQWFGRFAADGEHLDGHLDGFCQPTIRHQQRRYAMDAPQ